MDRNDFEMLLRHWGRVYGPEPTPEWDEDSSLGSGALTGCLIEFLRVGVVSGPEPNNLTARGIESRGGARPMKAHPEADLIDKLCIKLYGIDPLPALVLRAQYCWRGNRSWKRTWVSGIAGQKIGRCRYDTELEAAKAWVYLSLRIQKAA